jgi:hypothetical protein
MSTIKYTAEVLLPIVKNSISVAEIIRKLGLRQAGGTQSYITLKIKQYGIDTSHFTRQNLGKISPKRKLPEEILIKRNSGGRRKSVMLRRALVESGVEYKCTICGIYKWNDKQISLQVNHKNRDWLDDRKENLEFLCPNCHSQTEGWCGCKYEIDLFGTAKASKRARIIKSNKKACVIKPIKTVKEKSRPQKGKWPSVNNLKDMMMKIPATEAAKIIGVSGTAIKKKCKSLNIETRPRGYWAKRSSGGIADTMALDAIENNIS